MNVSLRSPQLFITLRQHVLGRGWVLTGRGTRMSLPTHVDPGATPGRFAVSLQSLCRSCMHRDSIISAKCRSINID